MDKEISKQLVDAPIIPLIQTEDEGTAVAVATALIESGITVLEVVLRTDAALDCLKVLTGRFPHACVGAGTVLSSQQATQVIERGARFIVSPGIDDGVVTTALAAGVDVFPGIATASEAQHAYNLGLNTVKFFPAAVAGGVPMLKALGPVFRNMGFIPTGGIAPDNLADYLALPQVVACGGSWLTPRSAIEAGDFKLVMQLSEEARHIARKAKGKKDK